MLIYFAINRQKANSLEYAEKLSEIVRSSGAEAEIFRNRQDEFGNYHFDIPVGKPGIVVVLGGDGTFLQCANDLNLIGEEYPLFGINMGTLGFLTHAERDMAEYAIGEILKGNYTLEDYPLLSASVDNERVHYCEQAFNDVVIGRQGFARVITLDVSIDGSYAYQARCDGVLVSTAYGSTAYNVSLGGPVVPPGTPVFVVTPIAPHLPGLRPIIVPENAEVSIKIHGGKYEDRREALVTCDGRNNGIWLEKDEIVTIRRHIGGGKLLRLNNESRGFYDIFREKLLTVGG